MNALRASSWVWKDRIKKEREREEFFFLRGIFLKEEVKGKFSCDIVYTRRTVKEEFVASKRQMGFL